MITQIMVKRASPKTFISSTPGSTVRFSVSEFITVMSYRSKVWTLGEQWESINFENSNGWNVNLNRKKKARLFLIKKYNSIIDLPLLLEGDCELWLPLWSTLQNDGAAESLKELRKLHMFYSLCQNLSRLSILLYCYTNIASRLIGKFFAVSQTVNCEGLAQTRNFCRRNFQNARCFNAHSYLT